MFTRASSSTVRNKTTDWNWEISTLASSTAFSPVHVSVSCLCLDFLFSEGLVLPSKLDMNTPAELGFLFFCCFLRVIFRIQVYGGTLSPAQRTVAMSQVSQLSQGMFGVQKITETCLFALKHSSPRSSLLKEMEFLSQSFLPVF